MTAISLFQFGFANRMYGAYVNAKTAVFRTRRSLQNGVGIKRQIGQDRTQPNHVAKLRGNQKRVFADTPEPRRYSAVLRRYDVAITARFYIELGRPDVPVGPQ